MIHFLATEAIHLAVASLVAAFAYYKYKSWKLVILCLAAGMLIDVDHFMDYLLFVDPGAFSWRVFFTSTHYFQAGRSFLWFHGYEHAAVFLFLAWRIRRWRPVFLTVGLAVLGHILVDQFTNNPAPFGYFIIYRWMRDFQMDRLFPQG